jgi:homoserine kinase type II
VLAEFGLRPAGAASILQAGDFNFLARVPTDRGDVVLRRFDMVDRDAAAGILEFMAHLAGHDFPAPAPFRNLHREVLTTWMGRPTAVLVHLPGRHPEDLGPDLARQAGVLLARLHSLGRDWHGPLPGGNRLDLLRRALGSSRPLPGWGRFRTAFQSFLAAHSDELEGFRHALPSGPIHGDLHAFNVLVEGVSLTGLIDFDLAHRAPLALDLVVACYFLASRTEDLRPPPAECAALLEGYESVRPLGEAECTALHLLFDLVSLAEAASVLDAPGCPLRDVVECDALRMYEAGAGRDLRRRFGVPR